MGRDTDRQIRVVAANALISGVRGWLKTSTLFIILARQPHFIHRPKRELIRGQLNFEDDGNAESRSVCHCPRTAAGYGTGSARGGGFGASATTM